jgi:predicted nucleic acid-binding protein
MKTRKILDTSILIHFWRRRRRRSRARGAVTPAVVRGWAQGLIELRQTDAIVTPVYVEMIAGVTDRRELKLTQAFLDEFRQLDGGMIPEQDWREAVRLAQRVPRDSRPRQLGDCLIRAIANRLKHVVETLDSGFPR